MNNKTVLSIAVLLAFATGFVSSQMLIWIEGSNNIICGNNTEIMVINDEDYYPAVIEKIEGAHSSIDIVMYEMKWYGEPEKETHEVSKLALSLVKAHKRGVRVRIILEDGKTYGYVSRSIENYTKNWSMYFRSKGIEVRLDGGEQSTHDKLLIIDGKTVILGSTNWSMSALKYNHEANVMIESKEVAEEYEEYFEELWSQSS